MAGRQTCLAKKATDNGTQYINICKTGGNYETSKTVQLPGSSPANPAIHPPPFVTILDPPPESSPLGFSLSDHAKTAYFWRSILFHSNDSTRLTYLLSHR